MTVPNYDSPPGHVDARTGRILTALIIGAVAAVLDTTIVTIAIHTMIADLNTTVGTVQWVTTAYLLALVVAITLSGWLQDRLGGKRAWLCALVLFVGGSVLCALAWNAGSLIAFRAVQGIGGGLIFPLMQTLAIQHVRAAGGSIARIMAIVSAPIALGPIVGPILGGVVLNYGSWRWLFLINVPICVVGLVLAVIFLPPYATRTTSHRLDAVGLALLAPGLVGVLYGLSRVAAYGTFATAEVLVPLLIGLALVACFTAWAAHKRGDAIIDIRLFRTRGIGSSAPVFFVVGAVLYAAMFLLPLYWQAARGETVLGAALLLIPQGVGSLSRLVSGRLTDRIGARTVAVLSLLVIAAATVPFALASDTTSTFWLGVVLFVRGIGLGAVLVPVMSIAYLGLEDSDVPHASMLTRICQQLGASFGVAVVAVVLQNAQAHHTVEGAFNTSFWWAAGITVVGVAAAFVLPGRQSSTRSERWSPRGNLRRSPNREDAAAG